MQTPWSFATNYFKVPREVAEQLLDEPLLFALYSALLMRARYVPGRVPTKQGHVDLDVGQAVYGRDELAHRIGTTPARLRTALARLETLGFLTSHSTSRGSVATLVKFKETYANSGPGSRLESPADLSRPSEKSPEDRQRFAATSTTNEEGKNQEREREEDPDARARVMEMVGPICLPELLSPEVESLARRYALDLECEATTYVLTSLERGVAPDAGGFIEHCEVMARARDQVNQKRVRDPYELERLAEQRLDQRMRDEDARQRSLRGRAR